MQAWDKRKNDVSFVLSGHTDTITSLRLSPDGSYLMSNAMDSSVRIWDVRPYAPQERCKKMLTGAVVRADCSRHAQCAIFSFLRQPLKLLA